jgi:hypothetical protein
VQHGVECGFCFVNTLMRHSRECGSIFKLTRSLIVTVKNIALLQSSERAFPHTVVDFIAPTVTNYVSPRGCLTPTFQQQSAELPNGRVLNVYILYSQ